MTEIGDTDTPVLSEQLRDNIHNKPREEKSPISNVRRGKIAKVSKLFSAVSHSRGTSTSKPSLDGDPYLPEIEMFEK